MINAAAIGLSIPVLALVGWTFVMWLWMFATRIPAMQAAQVDLDELSSTGESLTLPAKVSRVSDNYNHLHEQPTLFYAIALAGAAAGIHSQLIVSLAWAYVGLRIAHSLVQATANKIMLRFVLFVVGSIVLFALWALVLIAFHQ